VRSLLDEAWFVEADEPVRLRRLVERHVAHGKPQDVAERWARVSDQANADLVAHTRSAADVVVHLD
jgi:uridine kinase